MRDRTIYSMQQCTNEECKLRFPATEAEQREICPFCKSPMGIATEWLAGFAVPTDLNTPTDHHVVAVLDNLRSIYNVGSIFRTAEGSGLKHLHLIGTTPTPKHPKLPKTALGAEELIPWTYHRNGVDAIEALKADGYKIYCVEGGDGAIDLLETIPDSAEKIALVVGNEVAGVDPDILASADKLVAIPMRGVKKSLNVTIAFGIAAYQLTT